jgi:putative aldouronate transport system substrate-binding protein
MGGLVMKKIISVLLLISVLGSLLVGCSKSVSPSGVSQNPDTGNSGNAQNPDAGNPDNEPITFDIFIPWSDAKIPPDDSPVMQQLFEKTGVRINRIVPPAEPEERLNIMLASDELPDLISFDDAAIMKQFKNAGKLLKLNTLLEENAPLLFNVNWETFKGKIADENGDFYFMPSYYTFGDTYIESDYSFNFRNDYFEEQGYNVPKTLAQTAQLLRDFQQWKTGVIPMALALGPQGHLDTIVNIAGASAGLVHDGVLVLDEKAGEVKHYIDTPEVKSFFKFLNELNVEGLIDPESPIMSAEMLKQKMVANQVWSYFGNWWEIGSEVQAYEESIGSQEVQIRAFPTASASIADGTYAPYSVNMHTAGVTLTTKCKDPARYMRFIEYINTEDGWLTANGIVNYNFTGENTVENTEGYDWIVRTDMVIDGKPVLEASAWMGEMWGKDENWWWNHGVEMMNTFTYSLDTSHINTKYSAPPVDSSIWWDDNIIRINELMGITGTNAYDQDAARGVDVSILVGYTLDPDWPEYLQSLSMKTTHENLLPRVIMASSAEEFEKEWNNLVSEMNKIGYKDVLKKYNEFYKERVEDWSNQ